MLSPNRDKGNFKKIYFKYKNDPEIKEGGVQQAYDKEPTILEIAKEKIPIKVFEKKLHCFQYRKFENVSFMSRNL